MSGQEAAAQFSPARREELAQARERDAATPGYVAADFIRPTPPEADRRFLLTLVDELAAALRNITAVKHLSPLTAGRPACICAVHEDARKLLSDLGPDA